MNEPELNTEDPNASDEANRVRRHNGGIVAVPGTLH
jgi:hypothetical protein